ncbi:MAG: TGS domain-containing protein [Candidatus Eisenbacteria bacterium]
MNHRDLKEKIARETKGKPPAGEVRILEGYLRDWPEFKGPYQEMRKKYERRMASLTRVIDVQATHQTSRDPFAVRKRGLAALALVGLPSSGKSSLMASLTGVDADVADYPYTTLVPNVGMMTLGHVAFEVVDLPAVNERPLEDLHYASGLKEAVLNASLIALVIDLTTDLELSLSTVTARLAEMGARPVFAAPEDPPGDTPNGEEEPASRRAIVVGTKVDLAGRAELQALRDLVPGAFVTGHPLSAGALAGVVEVLSGLLGRIVVTARDPSSPDDPIEYAVPSGSTVRDLADAIHHELARRARRAKVWGDSAAFLGQEVGLDHVLLPGDVVEIY